MNEKEATGKEKGKTKRKRKREKIGIIGVGNIGASILRGLLTAEPTSKIFITDAEKEKRRFFDADLGTDPRVVVCETNEKVAENAEVTILAVKPNDVPVVVKEIAPFMNEDKILISVAAGVPTAAIEETLKEANARGRKVIRVMPNIGARVREAVCAICKGKYADEADEEIAKEILSAIGTVHSVNESDMDVITGLSGSGIAFVAAVIDAMADGGVYEGLPRELSLTIAAQTAIGAAKMVLAGEKPSGIKVMTASPGGTTIRGLYAMESGAVKAAMMEAVIEATRRATEISKQGSTKQENKLLTQINAD
ncbi:pyrroline-5-carboxylate reductase [Methanophagales archaeon]|nr:MAG: pyrroline-5-carboxylate reductase [Methanophagales archaeon]